MLEVRELTTGYGAINVVWNVSLDFPKGQLTTIVGPNGAGKTTLLRALMGLLPYKGEIRLDGKSLSSQKTWNLPDLGLTMVPEGRLVFRDMTIEENLALGAYAKRCRAGMAAKIEEIYVLFPRLKERRKQLAGSLSGGEAQMLAMGRGLMSSPTILLIDEPSLGLSPAMVNELFYIIRRLKTEGVTMVLVEQNTHMAISVADQVYLMRGGKVLLRQEAANVDIDRLHELYLAQEQG